MNKSLTLINDNIGTVSDEYGNIGVVTKENDAYELKDILVKENELNDKKTKLENSKYNLNINKIKISLGETLIGVAVVVPALMFLVSDYSSISLTGKIILYGMIYGPFRVLEIGLFGTRMSRIKERKELKKNIKELDEEVPKLENELQNMKDRTKFNKVQKYDDDPYNHEQGVEQTNEIKNVNTNDIKVLRLARRKI